MPKLAAMPKEPTGVRPDDRFRMSEPSVWQFWRHGVTSSLLDTYLTCREQCRLAYVEGLNSKNVPLSIEFGSCGHWILEQAYTEFLAKRQDAKHFLKNVRDWVHTWMPKYEKHWRSQVSHPSQKQQDQQELVYGLGEATLPYYFLRWKGDFTGDYGGMPAGVTRPASWEKLEEIFTVPWTYKDGKQTFLRGRRDGLFRDTKGARWIFDTKCRSVITPDEDLAELPFDLQQGTYLYATALEYRQAPRGTMMNIIRRPGQRRGKAESLPKFIERIEKEVSQAKNWGHYFMRYSMKVSPQEIVGFKDRTLGPVMDELRGWWEGSVPHYLNPRGLRSKYGPCSLFKVITQNDTTGCYRRRIPFPELPELNLARAA